MLKNLKLLREEAGLSQKQLGDRIGVSQQSINKYENHATEPDIATLKKLADCFQTSVDYLIGQSALRRRIEAVERYDLNEREAALIDAYRKLSDRQRDSIHAILDAYTRP